MSQLETAIEGRIVRLLERADIHHQLSRGRENAIIAAEHLAWATAFRTCAAELKFDLKEANCLAVDPQEQP